MARSKLSGKFRNRLLAALAPADLLLLEPQLTAVPLEMRKPLEHSHRKIDTLYFVEHGMASMVVAADPDSRIEVGLVGCEGVTGLAALLGDHRAPYSTFMQSEGSGQRISASAIRAAMKKSQALQEIILRYSQAFMVQTACTALANAKASIEQRLARWLLMAHDRVDGHILKLTHELLALMLGTRRAGVTDALHALARRGLIRNERGAIVIVDRDGLQTYAGKYYGTPEAEYDRMIG
jgi:CRP-like cAMP-binding protein